MKTTKETNKYISRKFIVWLIATLFEVSAIVLAFITKDFTLATQFTNYWGGISLAYIGGNVLQDFAFKPKEKE